MLALFTLVSFGFRQPEDKFLVLFTLKFVNHVGIIVAKWSSSGRREIVESRNFDLIPVDSPMSSKGTQKSSIPGRGSGAVSH